MTCRAEDHESIIHISAGVKLKAAVSFWGRDKNRRQNSYPVATRLLDVADSILAAAGYPVSVNCRL